MASSFASASTSQFPRWNYKVFLSFRGEDTRKTFTGHLFKGLENNGIFTFQDDKRLEHGASISDELLKAIEQSQVALVVFSKNYATSRWCLDELVKIMECKDQCGQTVIPVFYDVDPSHVRNQRESFTEAFDKHEPRYRDDDEGRRKLQRWRNALTAAANLKGYDVRDGIEAENIQQIVDQISKLCNSATLSSLRDVVGIDTHLDKLKSLLKVGINDVRIILGIWGMGGLGKTTIARVIFDILSHQFEAACFLADIKENEKRHQLHSLQNTLLSELSRRKDDYVNNKHDGKRMIPDRLFSKKVLIVLDDIDHKDHLEYLAGDIGWFGNGSRVVVTTRNKHLIEKNDVIYEMTALSDHESIQLFCQHAFRKEDPDEHFKKLSLEVVKYANGLPLALKVWGSLLHNLGLTEWKSAIEQMKINSNSEIVDKLKISYDGLEPIQQEMFLDIACFLRGEQKAYILQILESCHIGAEYGLRILIDKSLVFITEDYQIIQMHDLIQDMGKYIVNLQKNPGERSRLWLNEDFEEVMTNNAGTVAVEAIWVHDLDTLRFNNEAMKNMKKLRILYIDREVYDFNISDEPIEYLSNNLRWFNVDGYPCESLPSTFEPKMLVHLELSFSSLRYLWMETKHLPSLRTINLTGSESLMRTPDFTGMPNLEYLDMSFCFNLEEVHHSLGCCSKLIGLDLTDCKSLKRFPCVNVESLEYLDLPGCSSLEKFPEIRGRMKLEIQIHMRSGIRELPSSSFHYQTRITWLDLSDMENLVVFPSSICRLISLVQLFVSGCSKLESLPEEIGDLDNLEVLYASDTLISRPPSSIVRLNKLNSLSFRCSGDNGVHFEFPPVAEGLLSLKNLDLSYCNLIDGGLPEDIGSLSSLKELDLRGNNFEHLPRSIAQLGALRSLGLSFCQTLIQLPELSHELNELHVDCHMALKFINDLVTKRKKLQRVVFPPLYDDAHNDSIYNLFAHALFQNISSLRHDISVSDSLFENVFTIWHYWKKIPSWFHHKGTDSSVSVDLPENWYIPDKFLGFAVCYDDILIDTTAQLIPVCDDGMSCMTQKLALSECDTESSDDSERYTPIHFFFVPLAVLWDTSKANGKTPNDYGIIRLSFSGEMKKYGLRLLYKEEAEVEALLQMRENNNEPIEHSNVIRRSRSDNSEHHDSVTDESSLCCCRIL
ncbi:TMV resistance protein N-like [Nicotiana tabacum]|uniref:ADP-ribosyl cyclase/cyclic ADP-ribose hydrolase n=2 Tax=Nicotiana TaxID=4085 RepID=A9CR80_TOBAC|nr:TMV resistance protein N-like [Nicotiana tabacum]BAF95889.1 N-like protein [Nicotiana tabacum]